MTTQLAASTATVSSLLESPMFYTALAALVGSLAALLSAVRNAGLFTKLGNRAETNSASTQQVADAAESYIRAAAELVKFMKQNGGPPVVPPPNPLAEAHATAPAEPPSA